MTVGSHRVLLADDDPTMGLLMKAALTGGDFDLTVVTDGESALRVATDKPFDLVLLDVEMPGLDGYAVSAGLRQMLGNDLPIILVTSHDDAAFRQRMQELCADHIRKPVNWSALADQLRRMLHRAA